MMKRIAAPMVGGLVTWFALELLVYPVIYAIWKWRFELRAGTVVPALRTPGPAPRSPFTAARAWTGRATPR